MALAGFWRAHLRTLRTDAGGECCTLLDFCCLRITRPKVTPRKGGGRGDDILRQYIEQILPAAPVFGVGAPTMLQNCSRISPEVVPAAHVEQIWGNNPQYSFSQCQPLADAFLANHSQGIVSNIGTRACRVFSSVAQRSRSVAQLRRDSSTTPLRNGVRKCTPKVAKLTCLWGQQYWGNTEGVSDKWARIPGAPKQHYGGAQEGRGPQARARARRAAAPVHHSRPARGVRRRHAARAPPIPSQRRRWGRRRRNRSLPASGLASAGSVHPRGSARAPPMARAQERPPARLPARTRAREPARRAPRKRAPQPAPTPGRIPAGARARPPTPANAHARELTPARMRARAHTCPHARAAHRPRREVP